MKETANNKGFTLIEMMIVVALITILMGIAIPSLLSQRPLWKVNGAARGLLTDMRLAQSRAIRAGDPYSIVFYGDLKKYEIFADDGSGGGERGDGIRTPPGEEIVKTVDLTLDFNDIKFGVMGAPAIGGGAAPVDGLDLASRGGEKSIIFRPDGTAETGVVYLYPDTSNAIDNWQRCVEVVGNSGRVKIFSYNSGAGGWQ